MSARNYFSQITDIHKSAIESLRFAEESRQSLSRELVEALKGQPVNEQLVTHLESELARAEKVFQKAEKVFEQSNAHYNTIMEQLIQGGSVSSTEVLTEQFSAVSLHHSDDAASSSKKRRLSIGPPLRPKQVLEPLVGLGYSQKGKDIDISPPMLVNSEELSVYLKSLIELTGPQTMIHAGQDSFEELAAESQDNPLKIPVPMVNNEPDLLYSDQVLENEKAIGIEMPVERLRKLRSRTIVMIGVSGCGKTRTCFDLCRSVWGLYFDCCSDTDFGNMLAGLSRIASNDYRHKAMYEQSIFEATSILHTDRLLASRIFVLKYLLDAVPNLQPFDWLCIQRSRRSCETFRHISNVIAKCPVEVQAELFSDMLSWFFRKQGRIIFDESQYLLTQLEGHYYSKWSAMINNFSPQSIIGDDGKFLNPRSFFSFLSQYMIGIDQFHSIWCGTHMRIKNMDLIGSAAGGKPAKVYIFTDFTYLTPPQITRLLQKWVGQISSENLPFIEQVANYVQGRPRFLIRFLHQYVIERDLHKAFETYNRTMTTSKGPPKESLYHFWKKRVNWKIEPLKSNPVSPCNTYLVSQMLIKLCAIYFCGDGSSVSFSSDLDLVATSLVLVKKSDQDWLARMIEPLVVTAGLNYMKDTDQNLFMKYFAFLLFTSGTAPFLSAKEQSHLMELVIAIRFRQVWWTDRKLKQFLPNWAQKMEIPIPLGVMDARLSSTSPSLNLFIQQLRRADFPYMLFPPTTAGPDLRYSIFCVNVKTTWTANSKSTMFVESDDSLNWYKTREGLNSEISSILNDPSTSSRFVHMQFELPFGANSKPTSGLWNLIGYEFSKAQQEKLASRPRKGDSVILVTLHSPFAKDFFGGHFIKAYKKFVRAVVKETKQEQRMNTFSN